MRNSNNKSSSKLPPSKKKKLDKYEDNESGGWNNDFTGEALGTNQNQNKYHNNK